MLTILSLLTIIVSALSEEVMKMKYDHLNHIMEELKVLNKLHIKMMSQMCNEITPDQGKLLHLIKNEKLTQKEIAQHLHITEATLSVRMKRLVDSGFIERIVDEDDKRAYKIVLSNKGEQLVNDIEQSLKHYQEVICQGLTQEDYEVVLNLIHKIQNNLKEEIK